MRLPNGYGSIHKLSGNRRNAFRVRITKGWDNNGKQLFQELGCYPTRQEALTVLANYHKDPDTFSSKTLTLEDIYQMWWKQKEPTLTSKSSLVMYSSAWKHCYKLHNELISNIKLVHLQECVDELENKYGAKKDIKTLLRQLFDYAIANDLCHKNYAIYIQLGKKENTNIHKAFSEAEIKTLWKNKDKKYVDIILIYIYTGLRPAELFEIKKEDVYLKEGYLKGGLKTESSKNRIIPIHSKIKPFIEKWYNNNTEHLITYNDKKLNYKKYRIDIFDTIMQELKMKHLPHDTRHTFATLADNYNMNKLCIKKILGHSSGNITDKVYTHKSIEELKKEIEKICVL